MSDSYNETCTLLRECRDKCSNFEQRCRRLEVDNAHLKQENELMQKKHIEYDRELMHAIE